MMADTKSIILSAALYFYDGSILYIQLIFKTNLTSYKTQTDTQNDRISDDDSTIVDIGMGLLIRQKAALRRYLYTLPT